MRKEQLRYVDKVWGEEIWLVNLPQYCGKYLVINRNAQSSYHYHPKKQETFTCLEGYIILTIEGKEQLLTPVTRPRTIEPGEKHMFRAIDHSVILEVSTFHSDDDVVRLTESKAGGNDSDV